MDWKSAMTDGEICRLEARTSARFAPQHHLSLFLTGRDSPIVHGDIRDLSELGARVRADAALDRGGVVTVNVRSEYSFLFRAEAQIVWRSTTKRPREGVDCIHGILFTELSPFTRKLIRRLRGSVHLTGVPVRYDDAESDPDLQILFRAERSPAEVDADRLDRLDEPLESPPVRGSLGASLAGARRLDAVELSGNLGYFDNADVLQMLEATRATGVLHIEGPCRGEVQLLQGRVARCVSEGLTEKEAAFRLVVARQGRFHFIPGHVAGPENPRRFRTTTQLVLEAQLRRDDRS